MSDLLPPNAGQLLRHAAAACAEAADIPVPIRSLWDPDACPVALLPYLAWARSVDRWDPAWPESTKRRVIKAAWRIHKRKGTIGAIRRAVEPLGYLIEVREWWEQTPPAERGTFKLRVGVLETGITEAMYPELVRIIDDTKPLTRHMTGLEISLESRGQVYVGAVAYLGDELAVYPWTPADIEVSCAAHVVGADHTIDTLTINPQSEAV